MDLWGEESCRACLIRNDLSTMYDLAVPETMQLFNECSYLNFTLPDDPSESVPQHICNMCYRLCELWQSFRTRCQETDNKLKMGCPGSSGMMSSFDEGAVKLEPSVDLWMGEDLELCSEQTPTPANVQRGIRAKHTKKDSNQRKRKKRTAPSRIDPDTMEWGPGPNELGVWKHFHRDATREYAICLVPGCRTVVYCLDGSTGRMRYHATRAHNTVIPYKHTDTEESAQPEDPFAAKETETSDITDFEWAVGEGDT